MSKKKTISNDLSKKTIKMPIWIILIGLLSFGVIIARLCYLALSVEVDGINIQSFASSRNSTTKTLSAKRGTIYDVNGNVLAQTVSSYTLIAYLDSSRTIDESNPQHVVDIEYTATELAKVVDISYDTLVKYLSKTNVYQTEFGSGGKGLTELEKDEIEALNLPGIDFIETQKRYYPYGDFLSYTIGYAIEKTVTDDDGNEVTKIVGEMGIEKYYDDILSGTDGYTFYQRDRNGYKISGTQEITVEAVDGSDIYLSIDANVQLFLEEALENASSKGYGWEWYTILVADADTGAILGSLTDPSFNPNTRNMTNYLDYNVSYPFEPGSTMKIWTYMAVMENSDYDGSKKYKSGTYTTSDGTVIGDWNRSGWGYITYDRGFSLSSNTGIISLLNNNIDKATLLSYFSKLGFGSQTGVTLPGEASGDISFTYETEYYNAGFGQGITTTPIQNIKALTSIANDGMLLQPYYVSKIVSADGEVTYEGERTELYQVASTTTVNKIKDLMENVVTGNSSTSTGYPYYMEGYDLILKTGSAQVSSSTGYDVDAVIKGVAGMFPKDDPEIIFYIAARKPTDGIGGSRLMSSVVKELVTNISSYYEIYEDDEEEETTVSTLTLSSYVNSDTETVVASLEEFGVEVLTLGDGDKIIKQYPSKGIEITTKDLVILLTNDSNLKVPDFTGYSLSQVKVILDYLNLDYEIDGTGYVYKQSIAKNKEITDDMTITLYLKNKYLDDG